MHTDAISLKLKETTERRGVFERRYGMSFQSFQRAWQEGRIANVQCG